MRVAALSLKFWKWEDNKGLDLPLVAGLGMPSIPEFCVFLLEFPLKINNINLLCAQ